jgi:hypothetical protein
VPAVRRLAVLAATALLFGLVAVPAVAAPAPAPAAAPTVERDAAAAAAPETRAPGNTTPPAVAGTSSSSILREAPTSDDGSCASRLPVGPHVTRPGPSGLVLEGAASCRDGVWTLSVDGGSGTVAGMVLADKSFHGSLVRSRTGGPSGRVTVDLPQQPRIVPEWSQKARIRSLPLRSGWDSTVTVTTSSRRSAHLDLRGELRSNGTFRLTGAGAVAFAGTRVRLSGTYDSSGYPSSVAIGKQEPLTGPRWSIQGTGPSGSIPGARVLNPSLSTTQASPGLDGSAGLELTDAPYAKHSGSLHVVDRRDWALTVDGSASSGVSHWAPPHASDVSVSIRKLTGSIGRTSGKRDWDLTAPASYAESGLTVQGDLTLLGPDRWSLRATSGRGTLFDSTEQHAFTGADGAVVVSGGSVHGHLSLTTPGELLLDMADGWATDTTLRVTPRRRGSGWTTTHHARYTMVNGDSRLSLTGDLDGSSVFALNASGSLRFAADDIPISGYYRSTGYVVDGVALTAPDWSMTGDLSGAAGGRVRLDGGASLVGGSIGFVAPASAGQAASPSAARTSTTTTTTTTVPVPATPTGSSSLQLTSDDPFKLPVTYTYTDQNNWSVTAAGTTPANAFTPFTGLSIPETAFSGSIVDKNGVQTWGVFISALTWTGMSSGVTMTTTFSVTNYCQMGSECPDDTGIFFYSKGTISFSDPSLPAVTAGGSFTADKTWLRWDATSTPITYNGITISNPDLTIWKGQRSDDGDDQITMPDLSSHNGNGLSFEYCGDFRVAVPDVATVSTYGCLEWSQDGVVFGQVNTSGDVDAGSYNGIVLNSASLDGYAWSSLADDQDITLDGVDLTLTEGKNYLTATLGIPGTLMHDVGAGTSDDTNIAATGWFTPAGDFSLDGVIDVSMKSSGFTLDEITTHVGKEGDDFTLSLGAEATVAINGNHFPLDVYIGYEHSGDSTVTVSLDTHGVPSTQPQGQMDFATLLDGGDFEPTDQDLVDGSFDGNQPNNLAKDGGFENGTNPGNLVADPDFESTLATQLLPNNDFEDGSTGNLLANGDSEDTDVLVNGDFELDGGTATGWNLNSGYSTSMLSGTAPAKESGASVAVINNTGSSTATTGLYQNITWAPPSGTSFTVSGWVTAQTTASTTFTVSVIQSGCSAGNQTTTSPAVHPTTGTWVQASVTATAQAGCTGLAVVLSPTSSGTSVAVDAFTFALGSPTSSTSSTSVPGVWRPNIQARFDSLASVPLASHTSGVVQSTDFGGTLASNGCNSWMLATNSYGYASGDFDMSVNVRFPSGSNARDIADIGFWMNATTPQPAGYFFRLQSANGDGGFGQATSSGSLSFESGNVSMPDAVRDVWYQVRLTAVNGSVTANVVRLDTNATVYTQTLGMSSTYAHSGSFGQIQDGACSSEGSRWDDLTVYSANPGSQVRQNPANAHAGSGYTALSGTASNWSAEYSTGETPAQWTQYTYSAWVRSPSGTVSGNLHLEADGGTGESVSVPFTATTTWQQVAVTLRMNQTGHTDLRPGFVNMTTTGVELDVDDQVLQQVPWRTYPDATPNAVTELTSSDSHSGAKALSITDHNNGSTVLYEFPSNTTVAGSVYTFSAWVKSASPVTGDLRFQEASGSNKVPFTATSTWTLYTVTRTATGGTDPYVAIDLNSGHQGQALLVDDASLTVSKINATQAPALGAPAPVATWTNQGSHVLLQDDPSTSHGGSGNLQIVPPSSSGQSTSYTAAASPAVGSTYSASVWVWTSASGGVSTTVSLASGPDSTSTTVGANGTYQQVTVNLPVVTSGSTGLTLTVKNNNSSGSLRIDDASITLVGLMSNDPWATKSTSGYVSDPVLTTSGNAHTGTGYLEAKATGSGTGSVYLDAAYAAPVGTTHELTFFVISATGKNLTVSPMLTTYDATGKVLDSRQESMTVGTTWTRLVLSLPTRTAGAATIRSQIDLPAGATIRVDDLESRDLTWGTVSGPVTDAAVITQSGSAAEGANYLSFTSSDTGGGISLPVKQTVVAGAEYTMTAYVRSTGGAAGQLTLSYGGTSSESAYTKFTGTGSWQPVSVQFTATKSNTTITPAVSANSSGPSQIDVDSITLTPATIVQDSPWTADGSGVTFGVYDDVDRAHDSSYGLLEMSTTTGGAGVQHAITQTTAPGQVYNASAWVRSSSGTPIDGKIRFNAVGGSAESTSSPFTATGTWQLVSLRLPIAQTGHTGFTVEVLSSTTGVTLDLDDVVVQQNPWLVTSDSGGTATQTVVTDGASAQSGTGYLRVVNTGSAGGDAYLDTAGSYAVGSTWTGTVYVRSSNGAPVTGVLKLGPTGGSSQTTSFTAGSDWTPVSVSYAVTGSAATSLRTDVRVTTAGLGLDIDTATLDDGTVPVDGVTTPLPHPQTGWTYLWDDAFGIPGAHLWDLTAQVQFINGQPGLGVGATIYHDPTKSPNLMTGTDWLKGDMALNVSRADPCFSFDFATTGNSKVSIGGGVFTATDFSMNFAPRGCQIGAYVVPIGASLSFDAGLGSADVHFDISITEGDDGPEFTEDLAITNLVLAGTTYTDVELAIDLSATSSEVSMVADMILPMGLYHGDFDLSVNTSMLHLDGDVALSDWKLVGGGFDISDFNFDLVMNVPFGSGSCANFSADTSGHMSMASKTNLAFEGDLEVDCGQLKVLHLQYDYSHGGLTQLFNLDYNSTTHILAGGVYFSFERSTSWRFFGHRYNRHPKIAIGLTYSMDTTKPGSTLTATLGGSVSVSGGSGSLVCTINGGSADDTCTINVHITPGGGHTFNDTW